MLCLAACWPVWPLVQDRGLTTGEPHPRAVACPRMGWARSPSGGVRVLQASWGCSDLVWMWRLRSPGPWQPPGPAYLGRGQWRGWEGEPRLTRPPGMVNGAFVLCEQPSRQECSQPTAGRKELELGSRNSPSREAGAESQAEVIMTLGNGAFSSPS